jgi:dynein heavy chain 2, cytosolic
VHFAGCACRTMIRYGMVLKQYANFYNNIATEMIKCQKPMLLVYAQEFEKVGC